MERKERLPDLPGHFFEDTSPVWYERRRLEDVDGCVVVKLANLLTPIECTFIRDCGINLGLTQVSYEYDPKYRDCERTLAYSEQLSAVLWKRIKGGLSIDDLRDVKPYGHGTDGDWVPEGVNPLFRIVKYGSGGHFNLHRDGGFVLTSEHRSAMTILVYLNDQSEFEGGATQFVGVDNFSAAEVHAKAGSAVIFNHDALHAGHPVTQGTKYLLRTDLMFVRIHKTDVSFQKDPEFLRSLKLYDDSIALQRAGKPEESTRAFLDAMEIQARAYGSLRDASAHPPEYINLDCWRQVMSYLNVREHLDLGLVSKSMLKVSRDSDAWKHKYNLLFDIVAQIQKSDDFGFYHLFRYRWMCERRWDCLCADLSSNWIRSSLLSTRVEASVSSPAVIAQVQGHYWSSHSAFHDYMMGLDIQENNGREYGYSLDAQFVLIPSGRSGRADPDDSIYLRHADSGQRRMRFGEQSAFCCAAALLLTSFIQKPFLTYAGRMRVENMYHPLAVALPPFVAQQEKREFLQLVARDYPSLCFEGAFDASELLARYYDCQQATVIIVSDTYISCTSIADRRNCDTRFAIFSDEALKDRFEEDIDQDIVMREVQQFLSNPANSSAGLLGACPVIFGGIAITPEAIKLLSAHFNPEATRRAIDCCRTTGVLVALRSFCSRRESLEHFFAASHVMEDNWTQPKKELQDMRKFTVEPPMGITDETSLRVAAAAPACSSHISAILTYVFERRADVVSYFPWEDMPPERFAHAIVASARKPFGSGCQVLVSTQNGGGMHTINQVVKDIESTGDCSVSIFRSRWHTPDENQDIRSDIVCMNRPYPDSEDDAAVSGVFDNVALFVMVRASQYNSYYNNSTRERINKELVAQLPRDCQRWIIAASPEDVEACEAYLVEGKPRFIVRSQEEQLEEDV